MFQQSTRRHMGEQPTCCLILLLTRFTLPVLLPVPRWALTPPFHPYLLPGGIFSVALSIALQLPGVTRRHVLWSPDFPPGDGHPSLAIVWSAQKITSDHQIHRYPQNQTWSHPKNQYPCSPGGGTAPHRSPLVHKTEYDCNMGRT